MISLHNHSSIGSPLDGLNSIQDLFDGSVDSEHAGVVLTDHGSMAGIYDAWQMSKQKKIKLAVGNEIYFTDNLDPENKKNYHLVLIAQNHTGYKNLLKLNFEGYKNQSIGFMGKATPRISWEHIEKYNEGIFALTACSNGLVGKTLITERQEDEAINIIKRYKSIFNDRFFLEIQPHALHSVSQKTGKEVNQQKLNEYLLKYSYDLDIPYVITCDAHYRNKEMAKIHDLMLAIKDKKAVDDPERFRYGVQDMYLKTKQEIIDFFGSDIANTGINNAMKIFNSCEEPVYLESKGPILPRFPVKDEPDYTEFRNWFEQGENSIEEDKAYLRYKCIEAFKKNYKDRTPKEKKELWNRVKKELEVLELRDFSSYMLIVADYANWAKGNGIPNGPGRGSACGSLVAYLIGITKVDPIKHNLLFERFHNIEKKSFPDIDLDFSKNKKDLVKAYLKRKYGEDKVAYISNWSTLSPKVVITDVARSLNLGGDKTAAFQISKYITSIMPDEDSIESAEISSEKFSDFMKKYPALKESSLPLQGLVRNWSTHAAGVVLSDKPLDELVPLRIDKDGNTVLQWEKQRTENFGLVKMDILGVSTLDVIEETIENIKKLKNIDINIDEIPFDDKETFDMISQGKTSGVFQLESSLTPLCMKSKPKNIDEISDINALGRPSCSAEQRQNYINRKLGKEQISYRHPVLQNALKKTFGISLYEEGMMTIAKDCAGWDLNKADSLRKITKLKGKDPDLVEKTRNSFVIDTMNNTKMTYEQAVDIWENEIEPFGLYGFNASHSVAYSYISYQTAWLKCHYPTEFMCALLNSEDPNSDKVQEYLIECKNIGIKVLPPDLSRSDLKYSTTEDKVIITGLSAIKGVGETAIVNILKNRPYNTLSEFLAFTEARVVNKRVIESLAKAGAFDSLSVCRKDVFENYASYRTKLTNKIKKIKDNYNFSDPLNLRNYIEDINNIITEFSTEEWTKKEILLNEKEVLGHTISGGLHEIYEGFFKTDSIMVTKLSEIKNKPANAKVKVEVIINNKIKEFVIKNGQKIGQKFAKYTVEDIYGNTSELTLWSDDYEKYRDLLVDGTPIKAICKVNEYMGQKTLALHVLERRI